MILIKIQKNKLILILLFIFAIFFPDSSYAEVKNIKGGSVLGIGKRTINLEKQQEVLKKLFFHNYEESIFNLFPERNEITFILKKILDSKECSLEKRITAAQVLGNLRIDDDVDILVRNLLLGYKKVEKLEELSRNNFPVGFALIDIGTPAKLHLLDAIKLTRDEETIRLCAFVLMKIEDKDVARFILEREIKKETVASQKENLEKALSYLN